MDLLLFDVNFMVVDPLDEVSFTVSISFKVKTLNDFVQKFLRLNVTRPEYTSIMFPDFNPREFGVSKSFMTFPLILNSNGYACLQI